MGAKLDIRRAGGLTMVELVVVVAIIGIMAAVAIPSFARMGLLWRNDLQSSARELYTLLRAARIYAGTYNAETAVVYTTYRPEDSAASNLRAAALMYLHPRLIDESGRPFKAFVPVTSRDEGQMRTLPGNTGLLYNWANTIPGSERVSVYFPETGLESQPFYAHVFEPSGRLRKDGMELYSVRLGYTEDATADERFVDPAAGGDPSNPDDLNVRFINLNLYRATGRVEIASD